MRYRLAEMLKSATLTTREVRDALKISDQVLRRWMKNEYFLEAKVARKVGSAWIWNRKQLRLWVVAVLRLPACEDAVASNPPEENETEITFEQAREALGIPLEYNLRTHED
jgi:hypothetical protein